MKTIEAITENHLHFANVTSHRCMFPTNKWVDASEEVLPPDDLFTRMHLHEPAFVYCLEKRFQNEATTSKHGAMGEHANYDVVEKLPRPHVYGSALCCLSRHDGFARYKA